MAYTIRDLADRFGITLRALRFYEQKGLLSPARSTGGFTHERRTYSENDAFRIAEILRGARFGLSLREIKQYLVDGSTGPFLEIPPEVVNRQRIALQCEINARSSALAELEDLAARFAAEKPVGAFSGKPGTTAPPGVEKRAPASAR